MKWFKRLSGKRKVAIIGGGLLALLLICVALPSKKGKHPAVVGETVESDEWSYMVKSVERVQSLIWKGKQIEPEGDAWVVIALQIKNNTTNSKTASRSDFKLLTPPLKGEISLNGDATGAAGIQADYEATPAGFFGMDVPAGGVVETVVVFDVPLNAERLELRLTEVERPVDLGPYSQIALLPTPTPMPRPTSTPVPIATSTALPSPTPTPLPPTPTVVPPTAPPTPSVERTAAKVVRVIDGDTIEVEVEGKRYKVRYIGIDTPETKHLEKPVEWMGSEAAAKNEELVDGKMVELEKDVSETDKYGRLLRYVWVGDVMVNAELVRLGYAQISTYPPDVKYADLFLELQQEAREAGLGLWGPTPTYTAASPTATHTPLPPTPTKPAEPPAPAAEVTAWVDNPTPPQNSTVTVFGKFTIGGAGIAGVPMDTTWHYKSKDSYCSGVTDASGTATCSRKISRATKGYTVRIDVVFTYEGETYRAQTSFTPH